MTEFILEFDDNPEKVFLKDDKGNIRSHINYFRIKGETAIFGWIDAPTCGEIFFNLLKEYVKKQKCKYLIAENVDKNNSTLINIYQNYGFELMSEEECNRLSCRPNTHNSENYIFKL